MGTLKGKVKWFNGTLKGKVKWFNFAKVSLNVTTVRWEKDCFVHAKIKKLKGPCAVNLKKRIVLFTLV